MCADKTEILASKVFLQKTTGKVLQLKFGEKIRATHRTDNDCT
jgi:hypothetical protein